MAAAALLARNALPPTSRSTPRWTATCAAAAPTAASAGRSTGPQSGQLTPCHDGRGRKPSASRGCPCPCANRPAGRCWRRWGRPPAAGGGGPVAGGGQAARRRWARAVSRSQPFAPSVFVAIDPPALSRVWVAAVRDRPGGPTALPMLVAEELDADWSRLAVLQAPADGQLRLRTAVHRRQRQRAIDVRRGAQGRSRRTGHAGGCRRRSLVGGRPRAAARAPAWSSTRPAGRKAGYGELAEEAASRPGAAAGAPAKTPDQFRLIGKLPCPACTCPAKVTGQGRFGLLMAPPAHVARGGRAAADLGRQVTVAGEGRRPRGPARSPGSSQEIDDSKDGVAVVADSSWAALQGRDALDLLVGPGAWPRRCRTRTSPRTLSRAGRPSWAPWPTPPATPPAELGPGRPGSGAPPTPCPIWCMCRWCSCSNCLAEVNRTGAALHGLGRLTLYPDAVREDRRVGSPGCRSRNVAVHPHPAGRRLRPADGPRRGGRSSGAVWPGQLAALSRYCGRARTTSATTSPASARPPRSGSAGALGDGVSARTRGGLTTLAQPLSSLVWTVPSRPGWGQHRHLMVPAVSTRRYPEPAGANGPAPRSLGTGGQDPALGVGPLVEHLRGRKFPGRAWPTPVREDRLTLRQRLLAGAPRRGACLDRVAERAGWQRPRVNGPRSGLGRQRLFRQLRCPGGRGVPGPRRAPRDEHPIPPLADCGLAVESDIVKAQLEGGIAYGPGAALHGKITRRLGQDCREQLP